MRIACTPALVALLAACGVRRRRKDPAARLRLRASAPLGYCDRGVVARAPRVAVHDVSFLSSGRRVAAYLIVRPGSRRRPAVVFMHGSGGDRRELLAPAAALAARGIVTLTLEDIVGTPERSGEAQTGDQITDVAKAADELQAERSRFRRQSAVREFLVDRSIYFEEKHIERLVEIRNDEPLLEAVTAEKPDIHWRTDCPLIATPTRSIYLVEVPPLLRINLRVRIRAPRARLA